MAATFAAKNTPLISTPINIPSDRLWLRIVTATVASMTRLDKAGVERSRLRDAQSSVSMDTMIMIATKAATGTWPIRSPATTISESSSPPAASVESRRHI